MKKDEMVCDCDVIHEDVVDAVRKKLPDERELYDLSDFFKVLGDSTRVKIMWALDESEMCVCDLTEPVGLSQPTVSHHMKLLVEAGLVEREQRGRWAYYRPTIDTLASAAKALIA